MENQKVIIGRKGNYGEGSRLSIKGHGTEKKWGDADSVPQSVSREHVGIMNHPEGYLIRNLNARNVTFVNGVPIQAQIITQKDVVELGAERYKLPWKVINAAFPAGSLTLDISPLKRVWDQYNAETKKMTISEKRSNALKGIIPVLTMGAVVGVYVADIPKEVQIGAYAVAGLVGLITTISSFVNASKAPQKRENLDRWLMKVYRCPNKKCNHFFGKGTDFMLIETMGECPKCKSKFVMGQPNFIQ